MKLSESKTFENLARAYAGECQARTRYEFAEYGARYNGFTALSEIIDKVIYQEFNHARMLYTYIQKAESKMVDNIDITAGYPFKQKWDVVENLKLMAEDEEAEVKAYTEFEKTAREEGFTEIADLFKMIKTVEQQHANLFNNLHLQMNSGTLYKKDKSITWTCPACGYQETGKQAWDECPLCKAKQGVVAINTAESKSINWACV